MSFALTTPNEINMWVLLSRRSQIKLHLGYRPDGELSNVKIPVKGLLKWCKANIEGCESARTVRDCIVPVEYAIAMAGGPQDFSIVNVHVMYSVARPGGDCFEDVGIFPDMSFMEDVELGIAYASGDLEIVFTLEPVRASDGKVYQPA